MRALMEVLVRRRLVMLFLTISVLVAGIFAYRELPMDAVPDVAPPMVQIFTEAPGLSAQEVEKFITYPLETSLMGLPNVEKVRSVSNFGLSLITLYFKDGTDIYWARQLVGERLQEAREKILFGEPQMGPISTATGLVLFYFLKDTTGRYSLEELRTIQDWVIKPLLMATPGVNEVLSIGGFVKQYHVLLDPYRMANYGITLRDVVEAIERNNSNVGGQFITENSQEIIVRGVGMLENLKQIENIMLKSKDGFPVFLRNVADVRIGGEIRRGLQTMNGEDEVVAGMVIKLYGTNASKVISNVERKIEEINRILPEGISIVSYYEQKKLVDAVLRTVVSALLMGILLVSIVLFLFLRDVRGGLVVVTSLPFSLLTAVIFMKFTNVSLNLMSVGGLAIALGILVDATIVIVENIYRHLETKGSKDLMKTIVEASSEVMAPVITALVITVLSFIPLLTLEGVEGRMFKPLLYTILFALTGSIFYAFLVSPAISSLVIGRRKKVEPNWKFLRAYIRFLRKLYRKPKLAIGVYALLVLLAGIILPRIGSEFIPELQEGTLVIRTALHPAVSLDEAKRNALLIEKRIMSVEGVKYVTSRIGRGEVGAHTDPINSIETYIILEEGVEQRKVEEEIRKALQGFPGAFFNFTQPIKMTTDELLEGARGDIVVKVFGENLDTLQAIADRISSLISKVKGVVDVRAERLVGTPQIRIVADRYIASKYGLDIDDINLIVRFGIGGDVAGSLFEGVRKVDIFVRFMERYRNSFEHLKALPVYGHDGSIVPLSEVALVERFVGPRQITRENFHRFATVSFNVEGRDVGSVAKEVEDILEKELKLPAGYVVDVGGQYELQQRALRKFSIIVPIVIIIIAFLLFSTLNSLSMTLTILISIPVALVGGIVALFLSGENFSVPASIGFIALLGIATEVAVVLMSYLNELSRRFPRMELSRLCIRATIMRTRAVLMTVSTTALGLIPLVFSQGTGSEVQRPLAIVVIGGLITLVVVALFTTPLIYYAVQRRGG